MFKKNLRDVVKGIRANKTNPDPYIKQCIQEIVTELKHKDSKAKVNAIQKATYLHMIGHDMEGVASFACIELIGTPNFFCKRVAYLAASQIFSNQGDYDILCTQQMKKDLHNANQFICCQAINCISNIVNENTAQYIAEDIVQLISGSKPYVRKKAVSVLFRIFKYYPESLRPTFPKLKESLKEANPAVQAAAVNVICELAAKNPKNYLSLAPLFYNLLTTLHNNWTLIKIVKLMGTLTPHEKRLAKKLVDPMTDLIEKTSAKSVLYELCFTVTKGMTKYTGIVRLAVSKLKEFVQDPDQNLKYLGFLGLTNLMNKHPGMIADLKNEILDCLTDEDDSIRHRAVDLLCGVVSANNIKGIMKKLLKTVNDPSFPQDYKNHIVKKMIEACSRDRYANVSSFKWYLDLLCRLTEVKGVKHGDLIAQQLTDVMLRVRSVRPFGVSKMLKLLSSDHLEYSEATSFGPIIENAIWLIGEYVDVADEEHEDMFDVILPYTSKVLPTKVQSRLVQSMMKIFAHASIFGKPSVSHDLLMAMGEEESTKKVEDDERLSPEEYKRKMDTFIKSIKDAFTPYLTSSDIELQERTASLLAILAIHEEQAGESKDLSNEIAALFEEELNPVGVDAQSKVPVPEGLNLNAWIGEPFESSIDNIKEMFADSWLNPDGASANAAQFEDEFGLSEADLEGIDSEMGYQQQSTGYYQNRGIFTLKDEQAAHDPSISKRVDMRESKESADDDKKHHRRKKRRRRPGARSRRSRHSDAPAEVLMDNEMPEGYVEEKEVVDESIDAPHDALEDIDLSKPIDENEKLFSLTAYPTGAEYKSKKIEEEKRKKEEAKKAEDERRQRRHHRHHHHKRKHRSSRRSKKESKHVSPPRSSKVVVGSNDVLSVSYSLKISAESSNKLTLPLRFDNLSSSRLSSLTFTLKNNSSFKLLSDSKGPQVPSFSSIDSSSHASSPITFKVKSIDVNTVVKGSVSYSLDDGASFSSLDLSFTFYPQLFISAKVITEEVFRIKLQAKKFPYSSSGSLPLHDDSSIDSIAKNICRFFHFSVLQREDGVAYNLYASSSKDDDLALQLKLNSDKSAVSFKLIASSSNFAQTLSANLLEWFP
mmetsp:Transcript_3039/g.4460  ORF Transcript_3039/g.4460 Transcript_3039/m.4460 type:complete len:1102 (+) Transcript_3039:15-3320(+)